MRTQLLEFELPKPATWRAVAALESVDAPDDVGLWQAAAVSGTT
jgi:hypothetical protein